MTEHVNFIRVSNGTETVGYRDCGSALAGLFQGLGDNVLGLRIQGRRCLKNACFI